MGFTRETVLGSAAVLSILPSSLRSFWKMAGSVCRPASSFISVFRIVQFFSHLKAAMKLFRWSLTEKCPVSAFIISWAGSDSREYVDLTANVLFCFVLFRLWLLRNHPRKVGNMAVVIVIQHRPPPTREHDLVLSSVSAPSRAGNQLFWHKSLSCAEV